MQTFYEFGLEDLMPDKRLVSLVNSMPEAAAGMSGILEPFIVSVVNAQAWPGFVIGSLYSWRVIELQGYRPR